MACAYWAMVRNLRLKIEAGCKGNELELKEFYGRTCSTSHIGSKVKKTAELLVDSLESYRRLYECNGADSLRLFLRDAASSYLEVTAHSGVGYTSVFQFENELSDFEFTAVLDPQHVLGPKGLQVQVEGLGPYLGFLASMSLSGRKLLFTDSGHSATFRAKAINKILLNEFKATAYDQMPISKASEVLSANL